MAEIHDDRYDARVLGAIFVGGAVGTVLRAGLGTIQPADGWPWVTFVVNLVAAGVLAWVVERVPPGGSRHPLLATGLCGGLSTFATLQVEVLQLVEAGAAPAVAAAYVATSALGGYLVFRGAAATFRGRVSR